ncbi:MAG: hypothetical protein H7145_04090 [Akkermansiaceae bacterium]|nr:hypothetical protein [Armatimonadota bacterium]
MKPFQILCALGAIFFAAFGGAYASWSAMGLGELVQRSDVIARVQVIDNQRSPTAIKDWMKNETARSTSGNMRLFYHWVARVRMIDPIYGCKRGETLLIYQDNDEGGCPGVGYGAGEDVTVFLRRRDGAYSTINWTNGKRRYTTPEAYRELKGDIRAELTQFARPGNTKLRGSALWNREWREYQAAQLRQREINRRNNARRGRSG